MSVLASDNFNRADGGLGSNWTDIMTVFNFPSNVMQVVSNEARGDGGGVSPAAWYNAVSFPAANQYSKAAVGSSFAARVGVGVHLAGSSGAAGTGYLFTNRHDGSWSLVRLNGDFSATTLDSGVAAISTGDILLLEISGTTLTAKINSTTISVQTDGTYTSGAPGMTCDGPVAFLDDWEGGSVQAGSPWYAYAQQ